MKKALKKLESHQSFILDDISTLISAENFDELVQ
jgi:hypothetical protein